MCLRCLFQIIVDCTLADLLKGISSGLIKSDCAHLLERTRMKYCGEPLQLDLRTVQSYMR